MQDEIVKLGDPFSSSIADLVDWTGTNITLAGEVEIRLKLLLSVRARSPMFCISGTYFFSLVGIFRGVNRLLVFGGTPDMSDVR